MIDDFTKVAHLCMLDEATDGMEIDDSNREKLSNLSFAIYESIEDRGLTPEQIIEQLCKIYNV